MREPRRTEGQRLVFLDGPDNLQIVRDTKWQVVSIAALRQLHYADHQIQSLLALNGVDQPDVLIGLPQIKTIVP